MPPSPSHLGWVGCTLGDGVSGVPMILLTFLPPLHLPLAFYRSPGACHCTCSGMPPACTACTWSAWVRALHCLSATYWAWECLVVLGHLYAWATHGLSALDLSCLGPCTGCLGLSHSAIVPGSHAIPGYTPGSYLPLHCIPLLPLTLHMHHLSLHSLGLFPATSPGHCWTWVHSLATVLGTCTPGPASPL